MTATTGCTTPRSASLLGSGVIQADDSILYSNAAASPSATVLAESNKSNPKRLTIKSSTSSTVLSSSRSSFSMTTRSTTKVDIDSLSDEDLLGGEPNLLDRSVELQGVKDILKALTRNHKDQLSDPRMPIRHFRAEKGNTARAIEKLLSALQWRQEFQIDRIVDCMMEEQDGNNDFREIMKVENAPGKVYVHGYTQEGRSIIYMNNERNTTNHELNQMRHLVWNIEKAIACTAKRSAMRRRQRQRQLKDSCITTSVDVSPTDTTSVPKPPTPQPLDKHCILIDMSDFSLKSSPPMSTSKFTLDILQKHYPERIYRIYICHAPFAFRLFWNMVKPFIDPVTKQKIVMVTEGNEGMQQLHQELGATQVPYIVESSVRGKYIELSSDCRTAEFISEDYLRLPHNVAFGEECLEEEEEFDFD
jgi:hypothetical protein